MSQNVYPKAGQKTNERDLYNEVNTRITLAT